MAFSQTAAIAQIRDLVAAISGIERAFAPSENDANKLPDAINEYPTVLVLPGPTLEYIPMGAHRHTYEVRVIVYCRQGSDTGESAYQAMPLVDAVIEKFVVNVTLGNRVNSAVFARQSGFATLEYNDIDYLGWEITLRLSEQANAAFATGS